MTRLSRDRWQSLLIAGLLLIATLPRLLRHRNRHPQDISPPMPDPPAPSAASAPPRAPGLDTTPDGPPVTLDAPAPLEEIAPPRAPTQNRRPPDPPQAAAASTPPAVVARTSRYALGLTAGQWQTIALTLILAAALLAATLPHV